MTSRVGQVWANHGVGVFLVVAPPRELGHGKHFHCCLSLSDGAHHERVEYTEEGRWEKCAWLKRIA